MKTSKLEILFATELITGKYEHGITAAKHWTQNSVTDIEVK